MNHNEKQIRSLPHPNLKWAHSTCSINDINKAINDYSVTAIEADLLMGLHYTFDHSTSEKSYSSPISQPIMAHPPNLESDLTTETFLQLVTEEDETCSSGKRSLKKNIKLDFKDNEVIARTLEYIMNIRIISNDSKTIFLNADVIPGPGQRKSAPIINADEFILTCKRILKNDMENYAFSLGWMIDPRAMYGYTNKDVELMKCFIIKHNLMELSRGVVLAVNARVLVKNLKPLEFILRDIPKIQLLVWTASGEPPVSKHLMHIIQNHFNEQGFCDRVGYDCKVEPSMIQGLFFDIVVRIIAIFWNLREFLKVSMRPKMN